MCWTLSAYPIAKEVIMAPRPPEERERSSKTILVVDDDTDSREMLTSIIEKVGYLSAQAINGREAIQYLEQHEPPDLILLDLVMPVMDGWRFLATQGADPEFASIPVIVCSGQRYEEGVPVPPERFLRKPFLPSQLLAKIEQVFSFGLGSQGEQATVPRG